MTARENPVAKSDLRGEIKDRVPFEVDVMICSGSEILRLVSGDPFDGRVAGRDIVPFVGVTATRRRSSFTFPLNLPVDGDWCLKILKRQDRFVLGLYRRQMKAITYLGQLEKVLGVPYSRLRLTIVIEGWAGGCVALLPAVMAGIAGPVV